MAKKALLFNGPYPNIEPEGVDSVYNGTRGAIHKTIRAPAIHD